MASNGMDTAVDNYQDEETKQSADQQENVFTLSSSDLEDAFRFLDVHKKGSISLSDLKEKLGPFSRFISKKDMKLMMNGGTHVTLPMLKDFLTFREESTTVDPVQAAFKVYDPAHTGYLDTEVLRDMFQKMGMGSISQEDMSCLIDLTDKDEDGKIGLEDFRNLISADVAQSMQAKSTQQSKLAILTGSVVAAATTAIGDAESELPIVSETENHVDQQIAVVQDDGD